MTYKPGPTGGASGSVASWINSPHGGRYPGGFDAWSRRQLPNADKKGSSGSFSSTVGGSKINVWVTSIEADFTISGETGQSRMLREFFPRSFNDVSLIITGSVASTQEFNRLSLFIRETQWTALQKNSAQPALTFHLNNRSQVKSNFPYKGSGVKGPHRKMSVTGYIRSAKAGAVAHEIAPEFSIEFVVATSTLSPNTGIWSDIMPPANILPTILDLLPQVDAKAVSEEIWSLAASGALKNLGLGQL